MKFLKTVSLFTFIIIWSVLILNSGCVFNKEVKERDIWIKQLINCKNEFETYRVTLPTNLKISKTKLVKKYNPLTSAITNEGNLIIKKAQLARKGTTCNSCPQEVETFCSDVKKFIDMYNEDNQTTIIETPIN